MRSTYIIVVSGILILLAGVYMKDRSMPREVYRIAGDSQALSAYIKERGVHETLAELLRESDKSDSFSCHEEAHNIGHASYQIHGNEAFRLCDASCQSGCYHGAMEELLEKEGTDHLAQVIEQVCSMFTTVFSAHQCFHGVGHGLMLSLSHDLPVSLDLCRTLSSSKSRSSCMSGVFMQNIVAGRGLSSTEEGDDATKWLNRDPQFPCNAIVQDSQTQNGCYGMQTSWMLTLFKGDFKKVAQACMNAPKDQVATCFQSYGRDTVNGKLNPKRIVALCSEVPSQYYDVCIKGGLKVIVDFWGTELTSQADSLCQIVDGDHRGACWKNLADRRTDIFGSTGDN